MRFAPRSRNVLSQSLEVLQSSEFPNSPLGDTETRLAWLCHRCRDRIRSRTVKMKPTLPIGDEMSRAIWKLKEFKSEKSPRVVAQGGPCCCLRRRVCPHPCRGCTCSFSENSRSLKKIRKSCHTTKFGNKSSRHVEQKTTMIESLWAFCNDEFDNKSTEIFCIVLGKWGKKCLVSRAGLAHAT